MGDPHVRAVGEVEDAGTHPLAVGVDYDTVTLGWRGGVVWRLSSSAAEEFAQLFVSACWQAARQVPGDG